MSLKASAFSGPIGNMTSDGTWSYTWEHGRELVSMTGGGTTWTFTYDANGMRTKRTNGTTTYTYVYNGSQLTGLTVNCTAADGTVTTYTMRIGYDSNGPMYIKYNGSTYQYVTNLQGDVIALLNSSGAAVVEYTYDAWGNILSMTGSLASTLGEYNPLRYRSYVYDTETGLYYLQSRYYNPERGRFINADSYASTGQGILGLNMFAYCNNSPIILTDFSGTVPWLGVAFGAFLGGSVGVIVALMNNKSVGEVVFAGVSGALVGGITAVYPQTVAYFSAYNLIERYLDCLCNGYSFEETATVMGLSALAEWIFPKTGDSLADEVVNATFGTAKALVAEAGIVAIGNNSNGELTVNNITTATSGRAVGGGGKGYVLMYASDTVKGDLLWV